MNVDEEIHDLQEKFKCKLNYLKNIHKENKCYKAFLRTKKLDEEYLEFRKEFYRNREWR